MSILKSILHRWNSTSKAYDTLHPETESSQITDWHTGIMNSLASTTLGTVVSALTTDSVFGKLLSFVLSASGVKYSLGTNGYVKFGSFFGGLIIQWVQTSIKSTSKDVTFPVSGTILYAGASNNGSALTPSYAAMPVSAGVVRFTPSAWDPSGSNAILAILLSK